MNDARLPHPDGRPSLAIVSTYVPRRCGIATFSRDLVAGLVAADPSIAANDQIGVVAIDRRADGLRYPPEVVHRLPVDDPAAYGSTARRLDRDGRGMVSIQHEFGIYGGPNGRRVLELVGGLRAPVVTTLHTVLADPTNDQRRIVTDLARESARIVVMAERGRALLGELYGVDDGRVATIPHGVPEIPLIDPEIAKTRLGLAGRRVVLSFGLLSPNKRIELVIEALASVVTTVPEALYVVVGATHPEVIRLHGESYRRSLEERIARLGLRDHVWLVDRYVSEGELIDWLSACEVFVTPYGNEQQITSGTLAYAMAAGAAVVSTPYAHARELLADDRGVLVPFGDVRSLADGIGLVLTDAPTRTALRMRAHAHARSMTWRRVAQRYRQVFDEVIAERRPSKRRLPAVELALPPVARRHIDALSDRDGIFQHAIRSRPDPAHGQCTDDVARALLVDLRHAAAGDSPGLAWSTRRWLTFLEAAFDPSTGRFRNVRGADGRWTAPIGSEDAHGRALQALGAATTASRDQAVRIWARRLFPAALPAALSFAAPRPLAYAILGCADAVATTPVVEPAAAALVTLGDRLASAFPGGHGPAQDAWPWPEDIVTYDNGVLPQALIVAGRHIGRDDWVATGLATLGWLAAAQTARGGHLTPIGNRGWWRRGEGPARFDQQPIEAASLLEAAASAFDATGDERWVELAERAYAWFLGANDIRQPVADPERGACHDGLGPDGVNANQGAESTLCWLLSVERIRALRTARAHRDRLDLTAVSGLAIEPVRAGRWPVAGREPGIGARS
jgi:glycosyltransferase involved in cell wall biosynthesis